MRGLTKKQAEYRHFKRRLRERYGIEINRGRYRDLCRIVEERKAVFLRHQTSRVKIYRLSVDGRVVPVVWDAIRLRLVSALPEGAAV